MSPTPPAPNRNQDPNIDKRANATQHHITPNEAQIDQDLLAQYQYDMVHATHCGGLADDDSEPDTDIRAEKRQKKCAEPAVDGDTAVSVFKNLPYIDLWEAIGKGKTREEIGEMDKRAGERKRMEKEEEEVGKSCGGSGDREARDRTAVEDAEHWAKVERDREEADRCTIVGFWDEDDL